MINLLASQTELQKNQALTIFFSSIAIGLLLLLILVHLDRKLFNKQSNRIISVMAPTVQNRLLHSYRDFEKAASLKSNVLLYRGLMISFPCLLAGAVAIAVLAAVSVPDFSTWWMYASCGLVATRIEVWGMKLIEDFSISSAFSSAVTQGKLYLCIMIPLFNILTLAALLSVLYQIQGYLARRFRINSLRKNNLWEKIGAQDTEQSPTNKQKNN
ncbi:MAG TPA: hypothetical protein DEA32_01735 [Firmicutes bacterium]|nr:hypothetical protein [Bacillota bacterium]